MPTSYDNATIFQLRYISTATAGGVAVDLPAILESARRRNRADGITGLLLFNGARFLQLLEGEEDKVRAAYARISADPRHGGIALLGTGMAGGRAFAGWDMAYEQVAAAAGSGRSLVEIVESMIAHAPDRIAREFRGYARLTTRPSAA